MATKKTSSKKSGSTKKPKLNKSQIIAEQQLSMELGSSADEIQSNAYLNESHLNKFHSNHSQEFTTTQNPNTNSPANYSYDAAHTQPIKNPRVKIVKKQSSLIIKLGHYARLMRWHKPIGIGLLLWPTLWSLWIAAKGIPRWDLLAIFIAGVVVMRSAGCVINDFADRKIDGRVARTQDRPLATGAVSTTEAIILFLALCAIALGLVALTDQLTMKLSVGGLLLAVSYPFMKRFTHLPQVVLGAAFAWSVPMAFTAQAGEINRHAWIIYFAVVLWIVVYDTFYAMVDRDDDLKIGVKSTAILFGEQDKFITGALQVITLYALILVGKNFELGRYYQLSLLVVALLFAYQQWLIRFREKSACFKAFLNNNWVGLAVFVGIVLDYALKK